MNYDRVEDLVKKYQPTTTDENVDSSEKPLRQFSSRAIQISKGLYLKTDAPIGGNIDPELNRYVSSSEDSSDAEVMEYLRTLSESDRDLLLQKLQEKETTHRPKRRKHVHKHRRGKR